MMLSSSNFPVLAEEIEEAVKDAIVNNGVVLNITSKNILCLTNLLLLI